MSHDVFISHAKAQEPLALALVKQFEASQIKCWIARRDIVGGTVWVDALIAAIRSSRLMLVLLSAEANQSPHVRQEVKQAAENRIPILPVRIEDAPLSAGLWYLLNEIHWYDAFEYPASRLGDALTDTVKILLSGRTVTEATSASHEPEPLPIRVPGDGTSAGVDLDSLQVAVDPVAEPPEEQAGKYGVSMNTRRPGCFILLVDQSGSMNFRIAGTAIQKRAVVADAVNSLLYEAVLRATGDDGVKHRFDIGILGYGADAEGVHSAFGKDLASISEIAEIDEPPQNLVVRQPDGRGGISEQTLPVPVLYKPVIGKGKTVMYAAFERALTAAQTWTREHPSSFPPILINITDGGFTGKDPTPLVYEIQELCTEHGNALIFNCHISGLEGETVSYPGPKQAAKFDNKAHKRQLYEMSSMLPEFMRERAQQLGYEIEAGARGYVLNADVVSLINFMEIGGTRAMKI
jgi:TIR domain